MKRDRIYAGLDNDEQGGMNPTGQIILDAQVFGLIPETETCGGWTVQRIDALYDKVSAAWAPYGHLVSNLSPELRERHARIYDAAVRLARQRGWNPELGEDD
jgi:hypothetical protein